MKTTESIQQNGQTVPIEYSGKWVAWSHDNLRIVASGNTYDEVRAAATALGEPKAYLEKVPAALSFVGGGP